MTAYWIHFTDTHTHTVTYSFLRRTWDCPRTEGWCPFGFPSAPNKKAQGTTCFTVLGMFACLLAACLLVVFVHVDPGCQAKPDVVLNMASMGRINTCGIHRAACLEVWVPPQPNGGAGCTNRLMNTGVSNFFCWGGGGYIFVRNTPLFDL